MYTISSFSPDTIPKPHSSSALGRIGTIKLLILAIVFPIMILTIVNPMWVCVFMKTPHLHGPISNVKVHDHTKNSHTNTQFQGGIKITKETLDIIVASKDGRHLQELETSVTIIENVTPNTKNQPNQHNHESIMDRIRERVFKNRNNCAYFALTVLLLCAVIIGGVIFYFRDDRKMYYEEKKSSTYDEKNVEENNNTTDQDKNLTRVSFHDAHFDPTTTLSPPLYSSNTDNELISATSSSIPLTENIQKSVDENNL
ncbi:1206_t:CDS:2 [Funneliformis geosporum]|uniref:17017_t:CDS:1 n=1 Tax=Funneliformis geosporum TaxID=1117311 RepID=A0A9W4WU89_9GLOM|nr:1206_t:CDS:2 [Funneliformis geosporum]CAI2172571.1 17017_t:CDS:2 [Funneliformis geosporum]